MHFSTHFVVPAREGPARTAQLSSLQANCSARRIYAIVSVHRHYNSAHHNLSYDDLLRRYEEFATGDENFTVMVLIGAYLNASITDALLMIFCLWSPERNIMRQMALSKEKAVS